MYEYFTIDDNIQGCQVPIEQVSVFVDRCPDYAPVAIWIDKDDTVGLAIFEEFRAKMKTHFQTLNKKA